MAQTAMYVGLRRVAAVMLMAVVGAVFGPAAKAQTAPSLTTAAQIPAESFFKPYHLYDAELSPQGKQLAVLAGFEGQRVGIFVFELADLNKPRLVARFSDIDIASFAWVNEQRLVFDLKDRQAALGDRRVGGGLFSVRPDGTELRQWVNAALQFATVERSVSMRTMLNYNHMLLDVPKDGSDDVIIGRYSFRPSGDFEEILPIRLNVATGVTQSLARGAPDHAYDWRFDAKGQPRIAVTLHQGRRQIWQRPADGAPGWTKIDDVDVLKTRWDPLWVDAKDTVWVSTRNPQGFRELGALDPQTKAPGAKALISSPGFDLQGKHVVDPQTRRTLGYHVVTDGETTVWFDPEMAKLQKLVDDKLPGLRNRISCSPCTPGQMVLLVHSWSDLDPGRFFLYDQKTGRWQSVGARKPEIDPRLGATLDFHRFKARDGREIPVWVTLPANAKPGERRPTVVLIHGGPWVRGGEWAWQPMQQFLASRGYVVIEPEFRGSAGYGQAHFEAGVQQWGGSMQDDVADALQWAVAQGISDPNKACVAGGSYGGYATLMGLIKYPQMYRCGIAWVAVTDVKLLGQLSFDSDLSEEFRQYEFGTLVGDPNDEALMRKLSPIYRAAEIKAPVMLAFGGRDRRVPIAHGEKMRDALRAAGRDPVWVRYDAEGHGWFLPANQIDFAKRVEAFLGQHLR